MIKRIIRKAIKQYTVIHSWVGGIHIVTAELLALIGILTYVGVMFTVWYDRPEYHHYFFNNFFVFLFAIIPPFLIAGLLYYKFMIHARQRYQQHQMFRPERSPSARKLLEHTEILKEVCKVMGIDYEEAISRVGEKKKG